MTEHERLLEEFDDAYFALLMEGVANKEGEQLIALNEMLQNNPEAAVPESVDKRCLETIDRHFAREQRRIGLRKAGKALRLAAAIMAISVLLFTSAFALSEDFRVATLNLMLTVTEKYTQFDIKKSEDDNKQIESANSYGYEYFQDADIRWIPEGFKYCAGEYNQFTRFENDAGSWFMIHVFDGNGSLNVDTENAEVEDIVINGNAGLCVIKRDSYGGDIHIVTTDLTSNLYIDVLASIDLSVDTTKKIVENIYIRNSGQAVSGRSQASGQYFENAEIGWIPEGFECIESIPNTRVKFGNEQGDYFVISIIPGSASVNVDTENPESLEHITINGNEGLCVVKYGEASITLADLENYLYIGVDTSSGLSVETAKKIAENILII